MSRETVIRRAIQQLNDGEFGLTGIKVELEANLNRRGGTTVDCDTCNSGSICSTCDGEGRLTCEDCEGSEWTTCQSCDGNGGVTHPQDDDRTVTCIFCDGEGETQCHCYDNDGYVTCADCDGSGRVTCDAAHEPVYNWGSTDDCHDFVMSKLVEHGLARPRQDDSSAAGSRRYEVVHPLVFSRFYNDGSVDSEWTFTISTAQPDNVRHLPHVIEVFNQLAQAIGNGCDVGGAGMHTALLHGENARYPVDTRTSINMMRFSNFRRSMGLVLPSLYFLGTSNEHSRRLGYRLPQISDSDKYSAVAFRGGSLEFRIFDTCYETPEAILDNIVVMANCVNKFWKDEYVPSGLSRIAPQIDFGIDSGNKVERFYVKHEHLDLLNAGLRLIKPSYYTVTEIKKQRKFAVTKRTLDRQNKKMEKDVENEYKEYEQRYEWQDRIRKYYEVGEYLESHQSELMSLPEEEQMARAMAWVAENHTIRNKQPLRDYIRNRLEEINANRRGRWQLGES